MLKILFFGDSLTAGYGLQHPKKESYPARINEKLQQEGIHAEVINAGLSGDTSAGGLARIDYWLQRKPDVFVLELGINDVMRGISPDVTRKNLQAIIGKVVNQYPFCKLALMGMQIPAFIPGPNAQAFRLIFKELAERNNMALVPFFLEGVMGRVDLNLQDGLHPSANGYQIIADRVWPTLKELISR